MYRQSDEAVENVPESSREITLLELASAVLRHWRLVILLPLLFGFLAGAFALLEDRTYSASASFVPQGTENRGGGGASAIAQQFGVSLGADRPGQSPQFYADLLRSRVILRQALESIYEITTEEGEVQRARLIDIYVGDDSEVDAESWREAISDLRSEISASVDRETGVVDFVVSAGHPGLAEQVAARLLELLYQFNTEARQSRAQEEGRFIDLRLTEVRSELLAAEAALQRFLSQNREIGNSPELLFEHERLQRQVVMRQDVYTSLLRAREEARVDAVRDTPLFTVIDHPAAALEGRGVVRRTFLALILGLMIAVFIAIAAEFIRRGRRADNSDYREFQSVVRQVCDDVRNPGRWLRGREKKAKKAGG